MSCTSLVLSEDNNLLEPCWVAGQTKLSTAVLLKSFQKHDIEAVDIISSCKRIKELIERHGFRKTSRNNAITTKNSGLKFRDIARLTFGATCILNQQVNVLLEETKCLLNNMKVTTFDFSTRTVNQPTNTILCRKRKKVITKQTTITIPKRARVEKPELVHKQNVEYFSNLLNEAEKGNDSSITIKEECTYNDETQQNITIQTITHENSFNEQDLMLEQGFGEEQTDLTEFEDLFKSSHALKRKSPELTTVDILPCKMPKLKESAIAVSAENASPIENIELPRSDLNSSPCEELTKMIGSKASFPAKKAMPHRPKHKIRIDKSRKLTRNTLFKHRLHYQRMLQNNRNDCVDKQRIDAQILLSNCRQGRLFPDMFKCNKTSVDQKELDYESTLRAIIGKDYTDELARNVCAPIPSRRKANNRTRMPIDSPVLLSAQEETFCNNNNNGNVDDENFDMHSVMWQLLMIWRNNPTMKAIDAQNFLHSFETRTKAALSFHHLMALSSDQFISLYHKVNSIVIDTIRMGVISTELIKNFERDNSHRL